MDSFSELGFDMTPKSFRAFEVHGAEMTDHSRFVEFTKLISPLEASEFFGVYWQKKPLLIKKLDNRPSLNGLFDLRDIDSLLYASAPIASEYDFFQTGSAIERSYYTDDRNHVLINRLLSLYREGGTLHHSNIQRYLPKLHDVCNALRLEFRSDTEFDMWLTKHNDFPPFYHYDAHDLFTFQVYGSKRWRLFDATRVPYREGAVGNSFTPEQLGAPVLDVVIEPGDILYMPTGTPHLVTTCAPHSLHVGFGVHPLNWRDIINMMCVRLEDKPTILSKTVPVRLLHECPPEELHETLLRVLAAAADEVDCRELQNKVAERLINDIAPPRDEHLSSEILGEQALRIDTQLERRQNSLVAVVKGETEVTMVFPGGGAVTAPLSAEEAFRFIAGNEGRFLPEDLPGNFDDASKLVLLRELVLRGLITHAQSL